MTDSVDSIREKIDAIDESIQALISERAQLAEKIAQAKQDSGSSVFYRAEREAQVLRNVMSRNSGPLSNEEMARLFREIMSACLALEQQMRISYLGPEGTFTQEAALKHFGHSVDAVSVNSIEDVFRDVEAGNTAYGVVPVENSTEGMVTHTLDQFINSRLHICGEVELRIHHCLLGKQNEINNVKRIYSHRQSLAQCHKWLDSKLRGVERVDVNSNAEAARLAANEENAVAIAGTTAAELYNLNILAKNIEDEVDNTTRFLVIGKRTTPASGKDKTSILLSTENRPGALHQALDTFAKNGISMTRIESRPSRKGMWQYIFFIDIEGHQDDVSVASALNALQQTTSMMKVLGSYPRAVF